MVGAQTSSIRRHFLTLLGCLLLVSSVSAQRGCQFRPGVQGICREITQCPIVLENLRNRVSFPILCGGFNRRNPIVCCPSDGVTVTPQPQTDISEPSPPVECGVPVPVIGDVRIQASRDQAIQRISEAQAAKVEGFQSDVQPLVVGGIPSFRSSWPWMALLGFEDSAGKKDWFCAGSLINSQWILTAAHCFNTATVNIVRLGEHDYEDPNDGANHVDFTVGSPVVFPNYTSSQAYHDLALLKLNRPVGFTSSIRPVCLPWGAETNRNLETQKVTLTGWGRTQFQGARSSSLLEVEVTVFPTSQCDRSYQTLAEYASTWPRGIGSESICSGDVNGGKDACQGDSGGPIVSKDSRNRYTLAGVVSLGYGCGDRDYPGLYANARRPEYLAWIKKVAF
ncbi:venom protease-like [Macrobrachium nipponense]|uniref:venom protease-like n=1 Tax=Macrobrachium nipponense TaxID=159736 RepID=UPI0030C8B7D8